MEASKLEVSREEVEGNRRSLNVLMSKEHFRFIVEGVSFNVRADLLRKQDSAFSAMLRNSCIEKAAKAATIEDVSAATFRRFVQWTYCGKYVIPDPQMEEPRHEANLDNPSAKETENISSAVVEVVNGLEVELPENGDEHLEEESSARYSFGVQFRSRCYTEVDPTSWSRKNQNEHENFTEIFLCHARLYVFAKRFCIDRLAKAALETLHELLTGYEIYPKRVGDIVALLEYVYDNVIPSGDGKPEPMREMLMDYICFELDNLMDDDEFLDLVVNWDEDLLRDFRTVLRKRISI